MVDVRWQGTPEALSDQWESLRRLGGPLAAPLVGVLAASRMPHVRALDYATAWLSGRCAGCAVAHLIDARDDEVLGPGPMPTLVLNDPFGVQEGAVAFAGSAASDRAVFDAIVASACDLAVRRGAEGVLAHALPGFEGHGLRQALVAAGFQVFPDDACAHVPLLAGVLGSYPAGLRSSHRNVLARKQARLKHAGLRLRTVPRDGAVGADAIERLYLETSRRRRAESRTWVEDVLTREFFELALREPGFRVELCETSRAEPVGVLVAYATADLLTTIAAGLDYDALPDGLAPAVFQCLHARLLAGSEATGCRWAVLGTTALEGKARLGALFEVRTMAALPLTARFAAALAAGEDAYPAEDALPGCHPYAEAALHVVAAEAHRRGLVLAGLPAFTATGA